MINQILKVTFLLLICGIVHARSEFHLNEDWHFKKLDKPTSQFEQVNLPHTFNANDADDGGSYYRGPTIYKNEFKSPCKSNELLYIQFDAAATRTEVTLNQHFIGKHDGAYTAFRFHLPKEHLKKSNLLEVKVDNSAFSEVAPLGGDFSVFGGLYKEVKLICSAMLHFDLEDYGAEGIYVRSTLDADNNAQIEIRSRIKNHALKNEKGLKQMVFGTRNNINRWSTNKPGRP